MCVCVAVLLCFVDPILGHTATVLVRVHVSVRVFTRAYCLICT